MCSALDGKGSNVGKHSSFGNASAWSRGVAVVSLVALGACGSRSQLKGDQAAEEDSTIAGSGGQNSSNSTGSGTPQGFSATSTPSAASIVTGFSTSAITTGSIPNTTFGSTTGAGAAPTCPETGTDGGIGGIGGNAGGGGEGGAPSDEQLCPVPFCSGWVHKDANCAEIQGSFFAYDDRESGGSSYIYTSLVENHRICALGEVNQVINGQYGVYWGAGFGLYLNQPGFSYLPEIYNAEEHDVTGFGFSVDALPVNGELRFIVRGDDIYCTSVITSGYAEYSLADLVKGCWDPVSTPHDYSRLTSIEWHFVSNGSNAYGFEVCLTDLSVYLEPDE